MTSNSGEEDADSGATAYFSSLPSGFQDFDFPRRIFCTSHVDVYSSSLNDSPRRHVPIGPNHQASLPAWRGHKNNKELDQTPSSYSSQSLEIVDVVDYQTDERVMGTCIIQMPGSLSPSGDGIGRIDCGCLDSDSVRCVRQHVMEERENLRKAIGNDKFVSLGFYDMGEEVAKKWTKEEDLAFHEIVYSNPASVGRNFWKVLSAAFPSRSKTELVSYYFNVFMLRKRAAQNRSKLLDIDSDDDEWHARDQSANVTLVLEEDEDVATETLNQDHWLHNEDISDESGDDDDDDDDNSGDYGDFVVGHGSGDAVEDNGVIDHISEVFMPELVKGHKAGSLDNISGSTTGGCSFQDDSCLSFECEPSMPNTCGPMNGGAALEVNETRSSYSKYLHTASVEVDNLYFSSCDAKVWDARFHMGSGKTVDILPTWNMIEDIFAQGMEDRETKDE